MRSYLSRIFKRGKKNSPNEKKDFVEVDFLKTDEIAWFRNKYESTTTTLNPQFSSTEIGTDLSKMGGEPSLRNFDHYPKCSGCSNDLNFVIQLYQKDHPNFYFPNEANLFQVFRCPNPDCNLAFSLNCDLPIYTYYFRDNAVGVQLNTPDFRAKYDFEDRIPNCKLHPEEEIDFPNFDDYEEDLDTAIEKKYGSVWSDYMSDNMSAKIGTKYNGYPSWTQSPNRPQCSCGKEKKFVFQISSEEERYNKEKNEYSDHGIMIGDLGNIYFFICENCGANSVETTWDCF